MKKGFTLVEILISIVVMTIGFFAVLAVQGSAIGAYNAGRDSTESSELSRAVIEYLNIEGQQWTAGSISSPTNSYTGTPGKPFDAQPVLLGLAGGSLATWEPLVDTPVDVRLARGADMTGAKFCIFARGAYVEADTTDLNTFDPTDATKLTGSPLFRVQIATLYAGPRAVMPPGSCPDIDRTLLDPANIEPLELLGFRVAYFGTMIVRRDFSR